MPRHTDSAKLNLPEVFHRVQQEMLTQLNVARLFEHPSASGHATEQHWLDLFARYLPTRYRAAPAFVIDSTGRRSRQIDIAIFDAVYTPPLFPHNSGLHLPAEAVYAVFEVKPTFSRQWLRDAAEKAASVQSLHRTSVNLQARKSFRPPKILSGLLATSSVWTPQTFPANLRRSLKSTPLDLGCCLSQGAFDGPQLSTPSDALIFFILHLLTRLREMGTAPAIDWLRYL